MRLSTTARVHNLATNLNRSWREQTLHLDILNGSEFNMFESGIVSVLDDILLALTSARVDLARPPTLQAPFRYQMGTTSSYHVLLEIKCELMSHFIIC